MSNITLTSSSVLPSGRVDFLVTVDTATANKLNQSSTPVSLSMIVQDTVTKAVNIVGLTSFIDGLYIEENKTFKVYVSDLSNTHTYNFTLRISYDNKPHMSNSVTVTIPKALGAKPKSAPILISDTNYLGYAGNASYISYGSLNAFKIYINNNNVRPTATKITFFITGQVHGNLTTQECTFSLNNIGTVYDLGSYLIDYNNTQGYTSPDNVPIDLANYPGTYDITAVFENSDGVESDTSNTITLLISDKPNVPSLIGTIKPGDDKTEGYATLTWLAVPNSEGVKNDVHDSSIDANTTVYAYVLMRHGSDGSDVSYYLSVTNSGTGSVTTKSDNYKDFNANTYTITNISGNTNTFVDYYLKNRVTYTYKVKTVNFYGYSKDSNSVELVAFNYPIVLSSVSLDYYRPPGYSVDTVRIQPSVNYPVCDDQMGIEGWFDYIHTENGVKTTTPAKVYDVTTTVENNSGKLDIGPLYLGSDYPSAMNTEVTLTFYPYIIDPDDVTKKIYRLDSDNNKIGYTTNSVIPFTSPNPPRNIKIIPGKNKITINWDAPLPTNEDPNANILLKTTKYVVTCGAYGVKYTINDPDALSATITHWDIGWPLGDDVPFPLKFYSAIVHQGIEVQSDHVDIGTVSTINTPDSVSNVQVAFAQSSTTSAVVTWDLPGKNNNPYIDTKKFSYTVIRNVTDLYDRLKESTNIGTVTDNTFTDDSIPEKYYSTFNTDSAQPFNVYYSVGLNFVDPVNNDPFEPASIPVYDENGQIVYANSPIIIPFLKPYSPTNYGGKGKCTPGDSQLTFNWLKPNFYNNNFPPFVTFVLTDLNNNYKNPDTGKSELIVPYSQDSVTITGLTNFVLYDFQVSTVINELGASRTSEPFKYGKKFPYNKPDAPSNLNVSPRNKMLHLRWNKPTNITNEGLQNLAYYIAYTNNKGGSTHWTISATDVDVDVEGFVVVDVGELTNGTKYDFTVESRVTVNNLTINSDTASFVTAFPFAAPNSPPVLSLTVTSDDKQLKLSWATPPVRDDHPGIDVNITEYRIYESSGKGGYTIHSPITVSSASADVNPNTETFVTGLTNGTYYDFLIAAVVTELDVTKVSPYVHFDGYQVGFAPFGTPDQPENLTVYPDDSQLTLSWTAPKNTGGDGILITEYHIYELNGQGNYTIDSPLIVPSTSNDGEKSATLRDLTNGTHYDYRITSYINGHNNTKESINVGEFPSAYPFATPGVPTELTVAPGDEQLVLSWNTPEYTGGDGAYITEYHIMDSLGNYKDLIKITSDSDTANPPTTTTVDGLMNGTTYNFSIVSVITEFGVTKMSESASFDAYFPYRSPSQVLNFNAMPADGPIDGVSPLGDFTVNLSWEEPADLGGLNVDKYVVTRTYVAKSRGDVVLPLHGVGGDVRPPTDAEAFSAALVTLPESADIYEGKDLTFTDTVNDYGMEYTYTIKVYTTRDEPSGTVTGESDNTEAKITLINPPKVLNSVIDNDRGEIRALVRPNGSILSSVLSFIIPQSTTETQSVDNLIYQVDQYVGYLGGIWSMNGIKNRSIYENVSITIRLNDIVVGKNNGYVLTVSNGGGMDYRAEYFPEQDAINGQNNDHINYVKTVYKFDLDSTIFNEVVDKAKQVSDDAVSQQAITDATTIDNSSASYAQGKIDQSVDDARAIDTKFGLEQKDTDVNVALSKAQNKTDTAVSDQVATDAKAIDAKFGLEQKDTDVNVALDKAKTKTDTAVSDQVAIDAKAIDAEFGVEQNDTDVNVALNRVRNVVNIANIAMYTKGKSDQDALDAQAIDEALKLDLPYDTNVADALARATDPHSVTGKAIIDGVIDKINAIIYKAYTDSNTIYDGTSNKLYIIYTAKNDASDLEQGTNDFSDSSDFFTNYNALQIIANDAQDSIATSLVAVRSKADLANAALNDLNNLFVSLTPSEDQLLKFNLTKDVVGYVNGYIDNVNYNQVYGYLILAQMQVDLAQAYSRGVNSYAGDAATYLGIAQSETNLGSVLTLVNNANTALTNAQNLTAKITPIQDVVDGIVNLATNSGATNPSNQENLYDIQVSQQQVVDALSSANTSVDTIKTINDNIIDVKQRAEQLDIDNQQVSFIRDDSDSAEAYSNDCSDYRKNAEDLKTHSDTVLGNLQDNIDTLTDDDIQNAITEIQQDADAAQAAADAAQTAADNVKDQYDTANNFLSIIADSTIYANALSIVNNIFNSYITNADTEAAVAQGAADDANGNVDTAKSSKPKKVVEGYKDAAIANRDQVQKFSNNIKYAYEQIQIDGFLSQDEADGSKNALRGMIDIVNMYNQKSQDAASNASNAGKGFKDKSIQDNITAAQQAAQAASGYYTTAHSNYDSAITIIDNYILQQEEILSKEG